MSGFKKTVLANGFTIATDTLPGCKIFASEWLLKSGSNRDKPGRGGTAHFFEHLLGDANKDFPDFKWDRVSRWAGNSYEKTLVTTNNITGCRMNSLAGRAQEWLSIQASMIASPILDEGAVKKERRIIHQEFLDRKADQERFFFWNRVGALLFPEQTPSRDIVGTEDEILNAIQAEDLKAYYDDHYLAGDMALIVSGPLQHEEVLNIVATKLSTIKAGNNPAAEKNHIFLGHSENCHNNVDRQTVRIIFPLGQLSAREISICNQYVTHFTNLLDSTMRDTGFVYGANMSFQIFDKTDCVYIEYKTRPDQVRDSLKIIREVFDKRNDIFNDKILADAGEHAEFSEALGSFNPIHRASEIRFGYHRDNEILPYEEGIKNDLPASKEELNQVHEFLKTSDFSFFGFGNCQDWPSHEEVEKILRTENDEHAAPKLRQIFPSMTL